MKILDAIHTNNLSLKVTFLNGNKTVIKNIDLHSYLENHPNPHTRKMANQTLLSDIDIHLDRLSWKGNVLDIDVDTLYKL